MERSDPVYKTWLSLLKKEKKAGYTSLSPAERAFYNIYLLDLEVYNGGFVQYFGNTEGFYADELINALVVIGAIETAERVNALFRNVFPEGIPAAAAERAELARRVEDDYEAFETQESELTSWYCKDSESIFQRLENYARNSGFLVK